MRISVTAEGCPYDPHLQPEALQMHRQNVLIFQVDSGGWRWFIVGFYQSSALLRTSASAPAGLLYWWPGILTQTWRIRRGKAAERRFYWPLWTPVWITYLCPSSPATNPGCGTVGRGVCVAKGGRCDTGRTNFLVWTAVCSETYLPRNSGTTQIISFVLGCLYGAAQQ